MGLPGISDHGGTRQTRRGRARRRLSPNPGEPESASSPETLPIEPIGDAVEWDVESLIHLVVISPQLQAVHLRSDPLLPLSALNRSKQTENALNAIRISAPRDLTRIGMMIRNA